MLPIYTRDLTVEEHLHLYGSAWTPDGIATTLNGIHYLTVNDAVLHYLYGTATGQIMRLPDATTCALGKHFIIQNASSQVVEVAYSDGTEWFFLNSGTRASLFLVDNQTQNGTWIRTISSSSLFSGSAPVFGAYNGNANVGRYLEIFPAQSSFDAPFNVPVDLSIIAFELSAVSASSFTLGTFVLPNTTTPIYSITMDSAIYPDYTNVQLDLNVLLTKGQKLAFKVTAATGNISKPRMSMYISGR